MSMSTVIGHPRQDVPISTESAKRCEIVLMEDDTPMFGQFQTVLINHILWMQSFGMVNGSTMHFSSPGISFKNRLLLLHLSKELTCRPFFFFY